MFTEITSILKDNEIFDYLYSINRKSIFSPEIPKRDEYLTEKEYETICLFLNQCRPYEIGKTQSSLFFVFLCNNHEVVMFYVEEEGESLAYLLNYIGQDFDVTLIDDNWYIRINPAEQVRQ